MCRQFSIEYDAICVRKKFLILIYKLNTVFPYMRYILLQPFDWKW